MSYNPPNTSRRMPRHIRGFCVMSARKFKMINDPRRPNNKENGRTSANSVHVLRVLELITQAWKKFEYGFCRWHYNKIYKTFSEILPRLELVANFVWIWSISIFSELKTLYETEHQTDRVSRKSTKKMLLLISWTKTSSEQTLCIWTHAVVSWHIRRVGVLNFTFSVPERKQHLLLKNDKKYNITGI